MFLGQTAQPQTLSHGINMNKKARSWKSTRFSAGNERPRSDDDGKLPMPSNFQASNLHQIIASLSLFVRPFSRFTCSSNGNGGNTTWPGATGAVVNGIKQATEEGVVHDPRP